MRTFLGVLFDGVFFDEGIDFRLGGGGGIGDILELGVGLSELILYRGVEGGRLLGEGFGG